MVVTGPAKGIHIVGLEARTLTLKITCSCLNGVDEDLKNLAMCDFSYDALCAHWLSLKGVMGRLVSEPITEETTHEEHVSTPSCDPPQSEIVTLKKRVKKLEKKKRSRTHKSKRLYKVGTSRKVESSEESLGDQEDASKQGRKIEDIDADIEVTLVTDTQERNDEEMLFDVHDDLQGDEVVAEKVIAEKEVSTADPVPTASEVVTTANVEVTTPSAPTTTIDELTLVQTLIEIKAAKPKAVTSAATITTPTRPKARGVVVQEQNELKTTSSRLQVSQLLQAKDKSKAKII
ncbi:hypothetical protein Tco_1507759 [Tanacetum coccineum]